MLHALDDVGVTISGGKLQSPFREEMERLQGAAWRLFPSVHRRADVICSCCLPEETRARLADLPREAWQPDDLHAFAYSAHAHDAVTAERTRYLVPRFLQMLSRGVEPADWQSIHDSPLHHLSGDRRHSGWTQAEQALIDGFLSAWCCHAALWDLASDALPEDAFPEEADEGSMWQRLEIATDAGTPPVPILRRVLNQAGHGGAYGAAQMLTMSQD